MSLKTTLTFSKEDAACEKIRRELLICDAESALLDYFDLNPSERLSCPEFEAMTGYSIEEALDPKSGNYLLETMADRFDEMMENNIAYYSDAPSSKACWEAVIEELIC